MQLCTT